MVVFDLDRFSMVFDRNSSATNLPQILPQGFFFWSTLGRRMQESQESRGDFVRRHEILAQIKCSSSRGSSG